VHGASGARSAPVKPIMEFRAGGKDRKRQDEDNR